MSCVGSVPHIIATCSLWFFFGAIMMQFSYRKLASLISKVMRSSSNIFDAMLYYIFHFIYLGYPSDVLARLWLAHDIAHRNTDVGNVLGENRAHQAWKTFDESMRESYRAIGTLAGLLAGAMSGLAAVDEYRADETIRTLLLAGITSSVISASSCLSLLSTVHLDPVNIERHWGSSGIIYIITLSGPSAWLFIALLLFQAAILAIVWLKESIPAIVVVTTFIGIRVLFRVAALLHSITPIAPILAEVVLGLLGRSQGMSHQMVNLNQDTFIKRGKYLHDLANAIQKDDWGPSTGLEGPPITGSLLAGIERRNVFRGGLEEPTREDLNL